MELEINAASVKDRAPIQLRGGGSIMITPPIGGDFWLARVRVTRRQAVVCFPKFGTIGIGFQREQDWNTNLPYTCETEEIYNHIKHNKGRTASREDCIEAIKLLQEYATQLRSSMTPATPHPPATPPVTG